MPSTMDFPNAMSALASPLARRIFLVDGVSGVFLGRDFLTVSVRDPDPEWSALKPQIFAAIMEHFASGEPVLGDDADRGSSDTMIDENDSEVVQQIKELLETRIRPMVQEDGGDIRFVEFDEDGIVRLSLQGACSTCPSSTATLKGGIENMLMHYISEVRGVEEVLPEDDPELGPVVQANNEALERLEKSLGRAD